MLQYFFPCVYLYLKSVGVTESGKEETKLICYIVFCFVSRLLYCACILLSTLCKLCNYALSERIFMEIEHSSSSKHNIFKKISTRVVQPEHM